MPSVFDFDVPSLDIAQIAKPLAECLDAAIGLTSRCEKADSRNFARALGHG
jgi:hypothetical protein